MAEALLDDMAGRNSDFFFNEASPRSGLVRDRAPVVGRSLSRVASIAATGFGLSALCIAAKYNYLRPLDCEQRVEKTLAFLLEECPHEHGFLYHFIDIDSGQRLFGSELSSIDTALLLCGVLHCRQYFTGNARIEALATTFYRRIDWQWMMNGGTTLSMGWLPDQGFLKNRWDIYSELTTMYLLGDWLAHPPRSPRGVGIGPAAGRLLRRNRLHQRRRAAFHSPVPAGLVRLPQPARPARKLLHQLHCRNPGASALVPGAGAEISLDRSGYVGHLGLRFPPGISCLGRAAFDRAARRNAGALRRRRLAGLSARGMFSRVINHAGKIWR